MGMVSKREKELLDHIETLRREYEEAVELLREVAKRGNGMDMRIAKEVENFLAKREEG